MVLPAARFLILFAALLPPFPAQAQPSTEVAAPSTAALERMCTPQGSLDYAFGQTGVPGSTRLDSMIKPGFALPGDLAPFSTARPRSTEWSGRLMEMSYAAKVADEDEAYDLADRIAESLAAQGWTFLDMTPDTAPLYLGSVAGYATLEKAAHGDSGATRVLAALDYGLGELTLTCARDDLLRTHAGEAFGKLPPGTPRPQVPEIAAPDVTDPARCADPGIQAQMQAMLDSGSLSDNYMAAMLARTTYRDRLTSWMMWKLVDAGKMDEAELVELTLKSVGDVSPGGNPFASLAMIETMLPIVSRIAAAETAGDPAALCLGLASLHAWVAEADALTLRQTEAVQSKLTKEAARLGVSLE